MTDYLKAQTLSLNDLLADIYGADKCASEILVDLGLEQNYIDALIENENLTTFYDNLRFAFECRFLHYSGGYRLLTILYRRYGLFEYKKETLEEISDSMGVSCEQVRQLQKKAIKRLIGGVFSDATGILLMLCVCRALGLDAMEILRKKENLGRSPNRVLEELPAETSEQDENNNLEEIIMQSKPVDLPKATFYISGSFDYALGRGGFRMLMECGEHKKYIEKQDIDGHSDVSMILLAVIDGLEMLRKPLDVTVYSNTLFGNANLYKNGVLRQSVPNKANNYELKEKIRRILAEKGHYLSNIADNQAKAKLNAYKIIKEMSSALS